MGRRWLWLPLAAVALLAGCGQARPDTATLEQRLSVSPAAVMTFDGNQLRPDQVRVRVGETVEWRNSGPVEFRVTADSSAPFFDSGALDSGQGYRQAFSEPGRFVFFSPTHSAVVGSVTVSE